MSRFLGEMVFCCCDATQELSQPIPIQTISTTAENDWDDEDSYDIESMREDTGVYDVTCGGDAVELMAKLKETSKFISQLGGDRPPFQFPQLQFSGIGKASKKAVGVLRVDGGSETTPRLSRLETTPLEADEKPRFPSLRMEKVEDAKPNMSNMGFTPRQQVVFTPRSAFEKEKPNTFTAIVERSSVEGLLGIHVDVSDPSMLYVAMVFPSAPGNATAVEAYNKMAPADRLVQEGDYIQQVNGIAGAEPMRAALKTCTKLALVIQRPLLFERVVHCKKDESLGLDLHYTFNSCSMYISGVYEDGLVDRSAPDVKGGDRIVSVNGLRGTTGDLLQFIMRTEYLVLGFARPPWRQRLC